MNENSEQNKDIEVQEVQDGPQEREENLKGVPEGNLKGRRRNSAHADSRIDFVEKMRSEVPLMCSCVANGVVINSEASPRIEFLRRRH